MSEDFPVNDAQIQASKCLLEFFVTLDAEMIPPPSIDPHITANIEDPRYRECINPKFFQQIELVQSKILDGCQPKKGYTEGSLMNGIRKSCTIRYIYVKNLCTQNSQRY